MNENEHIELPGEDLAYKPFNGRTLDEWTFEEIDAEIKAVKSRYDQQRADEMKRHDEYMQLITKQADAELAHLREMRTEKVCHRYDY